MSQIIRGSSGGGGGGIITINGDVGSVTGPTISLVAHSAPYAGNTLLFTGSGTTMTFSNTDVSNNIFMGSGIPGANDNSACVVIGRAASIGQSSNRTVLIGDSASTGVSCNDSVIIGRQASASDSQNVVIGQQAQGASGSTVLGRGSNGGGSSIVIGANSGGGNNNNITIGNNLGGTNGKITIGNGNGRYSACLIDGIRDTTVSDGVAVLVDTHGNLGTIPSAKHFKEDIKSFESSLVYKLNPVSFHYKHEKKGVTSYGLIAEEVEQVIPDLVVYDRNKVISSVKYHELPIFLLSEIQKLRAEIDELKKGK